LPIIPYPSFRLGNPAFGGAGLSLQRSNASTLYHRALSPKKVTAL